MSSLSDRSFVMVLAEENGEAVRSLASPVRLHILRLLREQGPMNVNDIGRALGLPQSTVASNVQMLEKTALIRTEIVKASKGQQKICSTPFDEIVIRLLPPPVERMQNLVEVAMPLGLYTSCSVSAPCGLCSSEGVIGLLDVPDFFLDPGRMQATLIWFSRGYVEYKFPNNAKLMKSGIEALEFSMEMSSEVPGTNLNWPSDISLWVNNVRIGTWTSPGDYGDKRGAYTPRWWKLEGSQYGRLTTWQITRRGTYLDGEKLSNVNLAQLDLQSHHSIRLRVGIAEGAKNPGGVNIFGRGFGNHDQDIMMRLRLQD
ncbi:ArsR/SmtB family transcription factor [Roseomonas marmotae]|uniref:Helix-turn-helix domain-containing protein n=1 Tax=Roseomonas marmotae TaxID=2768161 RepID=A0ABS3KB19_9PROT|nr:helix-turn-helix domain-containing protein [Roseomonas marmotae]MBO1074665.1 helix-turn-helix domain-containing protein [Roseomonas marmotae]QTI81684.1 helix-turn-helix domain-containing protein [Roseomonas marmotae]